MNRLLTILCILLLGSSVAQQDTIPVFDYTVSTAHGDLNKDGILDFVIVTQDSASNFGPYRLEIFFTLANGDKKLIVQTDKAIEKQYQNGKDGWQFGNALECVSIKRGVVWIEFGFIRGHMEHKFRYQNNRFELIGYSYANVMADHLTTIDFNLSTGRRIEKYARIDQDLKIISDSIIKIDPLPNLNEFTPFGNTLY